MNRRLSRRDVLRLGGMGAAAAALGGAVSAFRAPRAVGGVFVDGATAGNQIRLVATDGFVTLPGRRDPLYMFGFVDAPWGDSISAVTATYKGKVQAPAPILAVDEGTDLYLKVTNVGLVIRPDLDDSHTVHWHGFRNPNAVFDGVPEASIAVPVGRSFTYFYRPRNPGTYMYHCHFEDVEHVQMGMTGIVFVRPASHPDRAYNDASTGFDREFALLLNEIDTRPHDNLAAVQEFQWTNYDPNYYVINGRAFPHTIRPNVDPDLPSQPISSLVQCNAGDRVLLRFANLGYEQHSIQLAGIPMHVVGEDATFLGGNRDYWTNTLYIGPGEARDVLIEAPAFDPEARTLTDGFGTYNPYPLFDRNAYGLTNNQGRVRGGMQTEVRVYGGELPPQPGPNATPEVTP